MRFCDLLIEFENKNNDRIGYDYLVQELLVDMF